MGIQEGHKIIPILNRYIKFFEKENLPIFVTRDWHPKSLNILSNLAGYGPSIVLREVQELSFILILSFQMMPS